MTNQLNFFLKIDLHHRQKLTKNILSRFFDSTHLEKKTNPNWQYMVNGEKKFLAKLQYTAP